MYDRSIPRHGSRNLHPGCLSPLVLCLLSCVPATNRAPGTSPPPSSAFDGSGRATDTTPSTSTKADVGATDPGGTPRAADGSRATTVDGAGGGVVDGAPPNAGDAALPDSAPVPAPLPPNALEGLPANALVVYWGQNAAGGASGDKTKYEKPLGEI